MKKRILFISIFSISLLINIIPLFIFQKIFIMLLMSVNGIIAYIYRHKANFLLLGRQRYLQLRIETLIKEHQEHYKEFFWQFTFYWFLIPFYIHYIFFGSDLGKVFGTLLLIIISQFTIYIYNYIILAKEAKAAQIKKEQELKEQQQREELGYFK